MESLTVIVLNSRIPNKYTRRLKERINMVHCFYHKEIKLDGLFSYERGRTI